LRVGLLSGCKWGLEYWRGFGLQFLLRVEDGLIRLFNGRQKGIQFLYGIEGCLQLVFI
jgi:hypothetical protein